jgi:hypothetical protein
MGKLTFSCNSPESNLPVYRELIGNIIVAHFQMLILFFMELMKFELNTYFAYTSMTKKSLAASNLGCVEGIVSGTCSLNIHLHIYLLTIQS